MSQKQASFGDDYFLKAIADTLARDLTADLKQRVMAVIEPQVDEAIAAVVQSMEIRAGSWVDHMTRESIVKFIVDNKRKAQP